MNKRQQMAAQLATEFPTLKIGESGTFKGHKITRTSSKSYRYDVRDDGKPLRMLKKEIINWHNTAPIQLAYKG